MTRMNAYRLGAQFTHRSLLRTNTDHEGIVRNGHQAPVSLTFDDAKRVRLDVAVPELNKRHHCCPVKCRIESIVYRDRVSHCRSRMRKVPVKWAFSRKE